MTPQPSGEMVLLVAALLGVALRPWVGRDRPAHADDPRPDHLGLSWSLLVMLLASFRALQWPDAILNPWLPVVLAGLLFAVPWPLARHLLVPLGWVRAAYWATRCSLYPWRRDNAGGATFVAAWALLRQGRPDPGDAAWIRAKIDDRSVLPAASLATLGLLADARGDRDEARAFLGAIALFDELVTDDVLARRSVDWLVADAAAHGDWSAVDQHTLGAPHLGPTARWLGAVARRLLGHRNAPFWGVLEAQRETLPASQRPSADVLRSWRATHPDPGAPGPRADPVPAEGRDPVQAALRAQLALVVAPSGPGLAAAAFAWERALKHLEPILAARAAALGSRKGGSPARELRREIERGLAAVAEAHELPVSAFGDAGLAAAAGGRRRDELLTAIEIASEALRQRVEDQRWLPTADEAREWLALARLYLDGVRAGGDDVRRLVFRAVYHPISTLSVDLYNRRREIWLSNAMTRWLLREARAAEDDAAAELQERNLQL